MSKTKQTQSFGPNLLDVRVRERYLANGLLDPASLEKSLTALPDSADRAETLGLLQPAITGDDDDDDDLEAE